MQHRSGSFYFSVKSLVCFIHFFWPISKDSVGALPSELGRVSGLRTVLGGWDCSRSGGSACLSFCCASVQTAWLQEALCHRWAGLGREVHPGHLDFFFFFAILCLLGYLEKGCKKRWVHGLCGETELLESWAQILSPAAVSLQLFMLQMDETVVSAGQGRGSALLVQVPICSLWKGEVSASCTGFLSLQFPRSVTCAQLQNSAALVRVVPGCSSVSGTLTKCVSSTDGRAWSLLILRE